MPMKKTLILAALMSAAFALPTVPVLAADDIVIVDEVASISTECYVLPLLPDCTAEWHDYWKAKGLHVAMPVEWWTCVRAEEGAGHLLDCETD
jgi:hypothetical protein